MYNKSLYYLGISLFVYVVGVFYFYTFLNLIHILPNSLFAYIYTFIFFIGLNYFLYKKLNFSYKNLIQFYVSFIAIILISLLGNFYFDDISFDGQMYHLEAINQLINNWNPIFGEPLAPQTNDMGNVLQLVLKCFAKSGWYINAHFYLLSGLYNASKISNLILAIALFFIVSYRLRMFISNNKISYLITAVIILNPIFLNMFLSNMIDLQVTFTIYLLIFLLLIYLQKKNIYLLYLILFIIPYLINLKATISVYVALLLLGVCLYLFVQKKLKYYRYETLLLSLSFIIGFFVLGYSTYTRNWLEHGHVFYPVYGKGHSPMVAAFDYYEKGNQVINFFKAIFAKTGFSYYMSNPIIYKIPFTISQYELERYGFAGTMVGGFGIWFSAIFLMYCLWLIYIIYLVYLKKIKFDLFSYLAFIIIILASCLVNPHAYIARYSPQFYLIPLSLLFIHFIIFKKYNFFVKIYWAIVILNSLLVCGYIVLNYQASKLRHQELDQFKQSNKTLQINFNHHLTNRFLFNKSGIPFVINDTLKPSPATKNFYQSELIIK